MAKSRYGRWELDKAAIVSTCLERVQAAETDRAAWMEARVARYAKLRGFLPEKDSPAWPGASNAWFPMLTQYSLRLKAQLYNVLMGSRPTMNAKARQRTFQGAQDTIDHLLDYQMFSEGHGEQALDDFITQFVDDGTAVAFVRWVREEQKIYDTRIFQPVEETSPAEAQWLLRLKEVFPQTTDVIQEDEGGRRWRIVFTDGQGLAREATADLETLPDDRVEVLLAWEGVAHDGPVMIVDELEDIVVPMRVANLQPPGPMNPGGAPWVYRKGRASLDEIRRRRADGTYDLVTDGEMDAIEASAASGTRTDEESSLQETKDDYEGRASGWMPTGLEDMREILECYERWDLDGDGLEEDVIFWIARESQVLLRVRLLSSLYPGLPVRRPLAEARFISEVNRFYGISLGELLESLYDVSKVMLDQALDFGTIRNLPFGFYRPSSGLKQEEMRMIPGEFYPLDDPSRDVVIPQWGQNDTAWHLNMLSLMNTFAERLSMVSDVQLGRIPTGKASALRTVGTTQALMGQSDMRGEQVLRRLYSGLAQVYELFHRLNRRYLPDRKEIRVTGAPKSGAGAYVNVRREDLDADIDFEFVGAMLNADRQKVGQSLQGFMQMLATPLMLQSGLVGTPQIYQLMRDLAKALDLDPDRYVKPPAEGGETWSAEEVMSAIVAHGSVPEGVTPLEAPDQHLQRLQAMWQIFQQKTEGYWEAGDVELSPDAEDALRQYIAKVQRLVQQAQQQAQLAALAGAQGQGRPGGGGPQGPGGVLSTIAPPPMPTAQPNRPMTQGEGTNA